MKARTAKKADCRRQKKPDARRAAPSKNDGKTTVREKNGRFCVGNRVGKHFGQGQPVDHGGRPKTSVREMAREIAGRLNAKGKEPVIKELLETVLTKALTGDLRAFDAYMKVYGVEEEENGRDTVPGDIGVDYVDYRPRVVEGEE